MILLILVVVVAGVAAGTGLLGTGVLSTNGARPRSGILGPVLLGGLVVIGLGGAGLMTLGLGGGGSSETTTTPAAPTTLPRRDTLADPLPFAQIDRPNADLPIVQLRPADNDVFSPYAPVSGIAPGSVVRIRADEFEWSERGTIQQCVLEAGRQSACGEAFPVQFDRDGAADFQFSIRGDIAPGGCRLGQATCSLRLTGGSSRRVATVQTILVDRVVPGTVRVTPSRGLADGQTVEVSVTGFPAGTVATALLCAPPEVYDARRCASIDQGVTFITDATGAGQAMLSVTSGRLGTDAVLCGPRRPCSISVVAGPGFTAAAAAPIGFSSGPGVEYDSGRLVTGLGIAIVLVGVAVGLALRTDWTKPTEAATPELDRADLRETWDLDQLFGTDAELDERDPLPW